MSRRVVSHDDLSGFIPAEKNQVTPEGNLIRFEPDPDARRLQRSSSRMVDSRVIARAGSCSPRRSRAPFLRESSAQSPRDPIRAKPVQIGSPGGLKGSEASKPVERVVSHPVADKNDEFVIHLNQPAVRNIVEEKLIRVVLDAYQHGRGKHNVQVIDLVQGFSYAALQRLMGNHHQRDRVRVASLLNYCGYADLVFAEYA